MTKRRSPISADARVILALMKKQPQTYMELMKTASVSHSSVFRALKKLNNYGTGTIKQLEDGTYALSNYNSLEGKMRKALEILRKREYTQITLDDLAAEVHSFPDRTFKKLAYDLAHEYDLKIGPVAKAFYRCA